MHRSSYCGVNCEKCGAYAASDDELREKTAAQWLKLYKREFSKEEMRCEGCKSDSRFALCSQCDIPPCNVQKGLASCEDCDEFPCDRMRKFFAFHETYDTGSVFD